VSTLLLKIECSESNTYLYENLKFIRKALIVWGVKGKEIAKIKSFNLTQEFEGMLEDTFY